MLVPVTLILLLGAGLYAVSGKPSVGSVLRGLASWYGPGYAGRLTANGEIFNPAEMTAAHKTLPFNTVVKVTRLDTGASVVVRVNDRGPYVGGRIIDVSEGAAKVLDLIAKGVTEVSVEILQTPPRKG